MAKLVVVIFSLWVALAAAVLPKPVLAKDSPVRVTFLVPTLDKEHAFWSEYVAFMDAAADSLGMDLTVIHTKHRYETLDVAKEVLADPATVDYLVYIYRAQCSKDILELAEKVGVKSLITNSDVIIDERPQVLTPRRRFLNWIGHIHPDEQQASELLMRKLLHQAERLGLQAVDDKFHVAGIGGSRDTAVSMLREKGFREALRESSIAVLDQYVLSNWDNDLAYEKTKHLLYRYPAVKVYWAASDGISLSAQKAMKEQGLTPGRDAVTGGMDWSRPGIKAVADGFMAATVGGHFMEGGWALTLIYDYHHGKDFASLGTTFKSQMRLIDKDNMKDYLPVLDRKNWKKIDFKRFTRTHNPGMKEYDFSPDAVVRELSRH